MSGSVKDVRKHIKDTEISKKMNIIELFLQPLEKTSIGWIILSAIIGGGVGALIKLSLGTIAPERYKRKMLAIQQFNKYKLPLLKSADSLDRRLSNMITNHRKRWYDDENEEYYRVSTLYLFGQFLGWCKIVEDSEIFSLEVPTKNLSKFSLLFYTVFKSMTGFYYFKNASEDIKHIDKSTVYRFSLTAIGELMIDKTKTDDMPGVIRFVDFSKLINENPDFIKWFNYLEKSILANQVKNVNSARWNRLLVINSILSAFISCLDPKSIHTSKRNIDYPSSLNGKVKKPLEHDINKMGFKGGVTHVSWRF